MKNMFFIGFMGIFAWCNGMLAPAYAQGIINYSRVSCSGSAEVMFVFQNTEGRQLLGGDELIFREDTDQSLKFTLDNETYEVSRSTGDLFSLDRGESMPGLSCNIQEIKPISVADAATEVSCSGSSTFSIYIDNAFPDVMVDITRYDVTNFEEFILLNSERDIIAIERNTTKVFRDFGLVEGMVCKISGAEKKSEQPLFYKYEGEIDPQNVSSWTVTAPLTLSDIELEETSKPGVYEMDLEARVGGSFERNVSVVFNIGYFDIENKFLGGCSEEEDLEPGSTERFSCEILLPTRPRIGSIKYSIFAYLAD